MISQEITSKAVNLRAVSPAGLKLIGLLEKADLANEHVVNVLKYDPILTAKLLRACNSPSLGYAGRVSSVDHAVLLLGYNQILQMVLALAFRETLIAPMPGYTFETDELWRHSICVAVAAELVSHTQQPSNADSGLAFTAGLLHDIGKVAMNYALTVETQSAVRCRIKEGGLSRLEAERDVLGIDHAQVGAYVLHQWHLPKEIVEGVANHHKPVLQPAGRLSAVVFLANCLAHLAGSSPGWEAYALRIDGRVTAAFELTAERLETLVMQAQESGKRAESLMLK